MAAPDWNLQQLYKSETGWEKALQTAISNTQGNMFYPQIKLSWFKQDAENPCSKPLAICGKTDDTFDKTNCVKRQNKCMVRKTKPKQKPALTSQMYFLSSHGASSSTMFQVPPDMTFVTLNMEGTSQQITSAAVLAEMPQKMWQNLLVHNDNVAVSDYLSKRLPSHQANVAVYRPGDQFLDIECHFEGEMEGSEYFVTGLMGLARAKQCSGKQYAHNAATMSNPLRASLLPSKIEIPCQAGAEDNEVIRQLNHDLFEKLEMLGTDNLSLTYLYTFGLLPPGVCIVSTCRACSEMDRELTQADSQRRVRFDESVGEVKEDAVSLKLIPGAPVPPWSKMTHTERMHDLFDRSDSDEDIVETRPVRGRGAFKGAHAVSCDPKTHPAIGVAGITPDVWCEMNTGYARCLPRKKTCARKPKANKLAAVHNARPESPMDEEWQIQDHVNTTLTYNDAGTMSKGKVDTLTLTQLEQVATDVVNTEVDSYRIDKATNLMTYKKRYFQNWMSNMLPDYVEDSKSSDDHTPNVARLMKGKVHEIIPPIDRQWNIQEDITDAIDENCDLSEREKELLRLQWTRPMEKRLLLEKLAKQIIEMGPPEVKYRSINMMEYKMRHFQKYMRKMVPDYVYSATEYKADNPNLVRLMSKVVPELKPLTTERDIQNYVDETLKFVIKYKALELNHAVTKEDQNSIMEKIATKVVNTDFHYDNRIDKTTNLMKYKMRSFQNWMRSIPDYVYSASESSEDNANLERLMSKVVPELVPPEDKLLFNL